MGLFSIREGLRILNAGDTHACVLTGSANPAEGSGVAADPGSLYLRSDGISYKKTGVADTDWQPYSEIEGGGLLWETINTATTLETGKGYILDSSGGVFTVTMPAAPQEGDVIGFVGLGDIETNNVTVGMNGLNMNGATDDLTIDLNYCYFEMLYTGNATTGWVLSNTDESGNVDNIQSFIGNNDNVNPALTEYTEQNYINSGDPLENSVDKLDMALFDATTTVSGLEQQIVTNASGIAALETYTGSGGASSPDYNQENYIADGDSLEEAISKLDAAVKVIEDLAATGVNWREAITAATGDVVQTTAAFYGTGDHFSDDNEPYWNYEAWQDGEQILSTNTTTLGNIYTWNAAGDQWVQTDTLGPNNAVSVRYDFLDSNGTKEDGAAYMMNADSTEILKIADFDMENAASIGLSSVYATTSGTISNSDSVESAISKLDYRTADLASLEERVTVNEGDILTNASGIAVNAQHIVNVDTAHDNLASALLIEATTSVGASSNDVVLDTVTQTDTLGAKWFVIAYDGSGNRYACEIYAMHNGGTSADLTEYAILTVGTRLNVYFEVSADGTNMTLVVDNNDTNPVTIKTQRTTINTNTVETVADLS